MVSMGSFASLVESRQRRSFDVICAGQANWRTTNVRDGFAQSAGVLDVARMLARGKMRVGLATVVDDDRFGRNSLAELTALGIDVGGVTLATPRTDIVVVDGSGGQSGLISEEDRTPDLEVPPSWSSQVLLLSGLSPITSKAAATCKAARRARREGAIVVLDMAGNLRQWAGRDPRKISMVLREVDVAHCTLMDLAIIGMDSASVRRAMRASSTLVVDDGATTMALGSFGEVRAQRHSRASDLTPVDHTTAICAELARPKRGVESDAGRWHRILSARASASA
jgi:fructokinase/2-dehydro-3-deoxygluconokinase